ncbi:MAG: autotransporter domain-containing protein [Planctomycetes bacterium]|nr:autotransporter domain-containing protein [Planctomycetota bacterium]
MASARATDIASDIQDDLTLDGSYRITGAISVDPSLNPVDVTVSADSTLTISGSLTIEGGTFGGTVRNFGSIVVEAGGTLETGFASNAGLTNYAAGILDIYGTLLQNGASTITNYGMLIIRDGATVDTSITNSGAVGFESGSSNNAAALASALAGTSGSVQMYGSTVTGGYTAQGGWTGTLFTGLVTLVEGTVDLAGGQMYLGGILANSGIAHPANALTITFADPVHSTNANGIVFGANVDTAIFQNAVNSTMLVAAGKTAVIESASGILGGTVTLDSEGKGIAGTVRFDTTTMTGTNLEISAGQVVTGTDEYGVAELAGTAAGSGIAMADLNFSSMSGGIVSVALTGTAPTLNSLDAGQAQIALNSRVTFAGNVTTGSSQSGLDQAIVIDATNVIFDGDVVTTGAANSGIGLSANAYAIFNADVTSAEGLHIGTGAVGMFSGTITTATGVVVDGGTMTTGGSGAVLAGAGLVLRNGGVLAINEDAGGPAALDLNGLSLSLEDTSGIIVSTAVTSGDIVVGFTDYSGFHVEGRTFASDADVDAYLKEVYGSPGIVRDQTFGFTGHEITYAVTENARDDARTSLGKVLDKAGVGDVIHMIHRRGAEQAYDVVKANLDNAAAPGSGSIQFVTDQAQLYADLITAAYQSGSSSNGVVVGREEVEAITNHFFGLDLGRSITVASNTARQNKAAVLDRVVRNNRLRQAVEVEFSSDSALGAALLESDRENRFWMAGLGRWEEADRRHGDAGFTYKSGGALVGYDRMCGDITYGGTFGYTHGGYKDKAALDNDSSIDSYAFSAYGTYNHFSGAYVAAMINYLYSDYDLKTQFSRQAGWDNATFQVGTFSIGTTAGYDWQPQENLAVSATLGLYHYYSETNQFDTGYREHARIKYGQTEFPLDAAVKYDLDSDDRYRLSIFANAGIAVYCNASGPKTTYSFPGMEGGPVMATRGRRETYFGWNTGCGFRYATDTWDATVRYEYYGSSGYGTHRVVAAAGFNF